MFLSLLFCAFFLDISAGQSVFILNETVTQVRANEANFLICQTNVRNPTYEWFYFLGDNKYQPLISTHSDPRYHFTYPETGQAKIVCRVNHGDQEYTSEPIEINVMDVGIIHQQPPTTVETVSQSYTFTYPTEPPVQVLSTETTSTTKTTTTVDKSKEEVVIAPLISQETNVTILNNSHIIIQPGVDYYLVCDANFPASEYEWVLYFGQYGHYSMKNSSQTKYVFNYTNPRAAFPYRCRASHHGVIYESQTVLIEVAGQNRIQPSCFLIAIVFLINVCVKKFS